MASFHKTVLGDNPVHPSMAANGIMTIRLHRLHFNSRPAPFTLAMSWPHSQRVSSFGTRSRDVVFVAIIVEKMIVNEIENDY